MYARFTAGIGTVRRQLPDFDGLDRAIPLFWLAFLLVNVGTGVWALVLNLYLLEHGFGPDLIGAVTSFTTFGSAASAIPASRLSGRLGDRGSFLLAGGLLGATYLGQALFPQTVPELAFSFAGGAALSLLSVMMVPFLSNRAPRERRSSVFATSFVLQALALMLGSLLGGYLPGVAVGLFPGGDARAIGYEAALLVGGAVSLLSIIPFWRLPGDKAVHRRPRIVAPSGAAHDHPIHRGPGPFAGWGPAIFAGIGGLMATSYGLNGPFFNVYLSKELQAPAAEIGTVFFIASLAGIPAAMAGPALARAVGGATGVAIGRLISVPLLGLIPFFPSTWLVGSAFVLRSISASLAWPIELSFWTDRLPSREQTRAIAYRTTATNLSWGLAGMAAGQIILRAGYTPIFLASALLMTLVGAVYLLALRERPAPVAAVTAAG